MASTEEKPAVKFKMLALGLIWTPITSFVKVIREISCLSLQILAHLGITLAEKQLICTELPCYGHNASNGFSYFFGENIRLPSCA